MTGQELIQNILRVTTIINDAIKNNDIDTLEGMLKERQSLIDNVETLVNTEVKKTSQKKINEILKLENENNVLLEDLVERLDKDLISKKKEKNIATNRMKNIRSYITSGAETRSSSKFNRKT